MFLLPYTHSIIHGLKMLSLVYIMTKTPKVLNYQAVIQLLNNHYTQGLKLNSKTWCEIQNYFQDISNYFNNLGNIERTEKIHRF